MMNELKLRITPGLILATCCLPATDLAQSAGEVLFGKSEWQEWTHDWCVSVRFCITDIDRRESGYPNYGDVQFKRIIFRPGALHFVAERNDRVSFITEGTQLEMHFVIPDCLRVSEERNWGAVAGGRIMLLDRAYHCQANLSLDPLYHTLQLRKHNGALVFIENNRKVLTIPNLHRGPVAEELLDPQIWD